MIKAVLFDAAHTLIHVTPSVGAVYSRVARAHGVEVDSAALDGAFREAYAGRPASSEPAHQATSEEEERAWWHDLVLEVMARVGGLDGFGERFEAYFVDQFDAFARPDVWRLYDDVIPCLVGLEGMDLRLGIVSNWDSRLHRLMSAWDLGGRFEVMMTSAEAGYRKPHPEPFRRALEAMELSASEAIFVGDSDREDRVGAEAAGMRSFVIDRGMVEERDGRLRSLLDLAGLIQRNPDGSASLP